MKQKEHTLTIKVRFDKSCTKTHALKQVKDNIHGTFYPYAPNDDDPEVLVVKSFGHPKREG